MKSINLAHKRALFQTICFSFIGFIALSGSFFDSSSQIRDTGGTKGTTTLSSIDTVSETPTSEIASTFKGQNVTTAQYASQNTASSLVFNQAVTEIPFKNSAGIYCTDPNHYDAGNGIVHCSGTNFYYGHNNRAFANLKYANIGSQITVNGKTYTVSDKFQKTVTSSDMYNIIYSGHAISLMTCAGPNDSQRLVVFAD